MTNVTRTFKLVVRSKATSNSSFTFTLIIVALMKPRMPGEILVITDLYVFVVVHFRRVAVLLIYHYQKENFLRISRLEKFYSILIKNKGVNF